MVGSGNLLDGKYRLTESLGEGSMGSVWKAVHEGLGRSFAVKFLKDYGPSASEMRERFLREARLAAAVRHRFVVDVVDVGKTPEGIPYMVMEYLSGDTLAQRLRDGAPLPVRDLLTIVEQSLLGLEAVHRAGIVHRDLKPENIVLTPDGNGGLVPKLVDFGVSREITRSSHGGAVPHIGGPSSTRPGATVGTPLYMAPEQVHSTAAPDGRTDIYAAGVILYEALSGVVPFHHPNLTCLMDLIVEGGAVPMRARRPDLPPPLVAIVDRAISVNREQRFASAAEMAAALGAVVDQVDPYAWCGRQGRLHPPPPQAAPTPPRVGTVTRGSLAWKKFSSPPVLIGVAVAGLLILATAAGASLAVRQREQARQPTPALADETPWSGRTLNVVVSGENESTAAQSTTSTATSPTPTESAERPVRLAATKGRQRPVAKAPAQKGREGNERADGPAPEIFRDPGF